MTQLFISNDITVQPTDSVEPEEYFQILKNTSKMISDVDLKAQLAFVATEIDKARKLGQTNYLDWLLFSQDTIIKERLLWTHGFNHWIERDAIIQGVEKLAPKKSVKIIELDRYPRSIPDKAFERIMFAKSLGLFDQFAVLFTDLTGKDYKTKSEKEFVARNRDPVCFGYFKESKSGETHYRFYFVAEWADEFCHLSFDQVLNTVDAGQWGKIGDTMRLPVTPSTPETKEGILAWIRKTISR